MDAELAGWHSGIVPNGKSARSEFLQYIDQESVQAANMVKESANLLQESKQAKKKFVAQETPMENASKLSSADHRYAACGGAGVARCWGRLPTVGRVHTHAC